MFKHSKALLLVLVWLLLETQTQDWDFGRMRMFEGAQLPHIYSTGIRIGGRGVDFSQTYSFTIPENVFSTTESIYIVIGTHVVTKAFIISSSAIMQKMRGSSLWTEPTPKSTQPGLSSL